MNIEGKPERPTQIQYGITEGKAIIQFDRPIDNLRLNAKEIEDMIGALRMTKIALEKQSGETQGKPS